MDTENTEPDQGSQESLVEALTQSPPETEPEGTTEPEVAPVDVADVLEPKRYRVTGPHAVHGTPSGGEFTAQLDPGQEQFLLDGGHIEIAGSTPDVDSAN